MNKEFHIEIYDKLEAVKDQIDPGDFRFYNIAHFPLLAKYTSKYSHNCSECKENIAILNDITDSLPGSLTGGASARAGFEKKKTSIESHLKKAHQLRFPGYFTSLFSLIGVALAFALSTLANFLLQQQFFNDFSLIAIAVGIIAGIFAGKHYDSKIFKQNMQL